VRQIRWENQHSRGMAMSGLLRLRFRLIVQHDRSAGARVGYRDAAAVQPAHMRCSVYQSSVASKLLMPRATGIRRSFRFLIAVFASRWLCEILTSGLNRCGCIGDGLLMDSASSRHLCERSHDQHCFCHQIECATLQILRCRCALRTNRHL
jgi:hypothetical protein